MASSTFLLIFLFFLICSTPNPTNSHDFSISLLHRDSPMSPLHNSSMTLHDRLLASAHRAISHADNLHLRALVSDEEQPPEISTRLLPDNYEYIVSYKIGTPPFLVSGMLDTGSDFIWAREGYFFIPLRSSSYTNLSCDSGNCIRFGSQRTTCSGRTDVCTYDVRYRDGTKTSGILSYDKFAFDSSDGSSSVDVGYLMFGCSNECSKEFEAENGCVGLNRQQFSLISQLQIKRFSHCMMFPPQGPKHDHHLQNRMYFGSKAIISQSNLTPFVKEMDSAYYVILDGISIGQTKVPIAEGAFHLKEKGDGGVIVDSGITLRVLVSEGFDPLLKTMSQIVQKPISKSGDFEMCVKDLDYVPDVIFHFSARVDMRLGKENSFVQVDNGLWCFAILRSRVPLSVIGNHQMRNFWVGYDLENNGISFTPADCASVP